jgi:hypothetical protein
VGEGDGSEGKGQEERRRCLPTECVTPHPFYKLDTSHCWTQNTVGAFCTEGIAVAPGRWEEGKLWVWEEKEQGDALEIHWVL